MNRILTLFISVILLLTSCTSGKKAMQQGDYDEALYKAVNRLRSNVNHKKSAQTLSETYPLAQKWHLGKINDLERSYEPFKWEAVAREYAVLINLYNEISSCPGCLKVIPAPTNYSFDYERTKIKAASDRYEAGLIALERGKKGDREAAKNAFYNFAEADKWIKGYKETGEKMKEAELYSTIRVVVEPIPMHSRTLKLSNEFFDNKINEFLLQAPVNRFVKFYTAREANRLGITKPDQIIQLSFDDFVVGQTYMHEKETALIKDSIVLATYEVEVPQTTGSAGTGNGNSGGGSAENKITICHTAPGSSRSQTISVSESALKAHLDHGDKTGSCETGTSTPSPGTKKEVRKVYGQARANMHIFTKTIESKGLLDLRILDGYTKRVITQEKLPGVFVWQSQWGYFNGDERALDRQQKQVIRNKEVPPPAPQDLFIQFTQPIYQQLTAKIKDFYRNY